MTTFYEVPIIAPPQIFNVQFPNGNTYFFRIMYNNCEITPCWTIDIADSLLNEMVNGIPLVPGADMLEQYGYLGLGCIMWCTTDGDELQVPTRDNLGSTAHLWIATNP